MVSFEFVTTVEVKLFNLPYLHRSLGHDLFFLLPPNAFVGRS